MTTKALFPNMRRPLLSHYHPSIYFAAVWCYRALRLIRWHFDGRRYSYYRDSQSLPHRVKEHSSVLIRKLPDDQMYMQRNKITNLSIAIGQLDGIVIRPGDTFSFCKLVGLPTRARGFLEGMEISRGVARPGVGGGICQISNLLYWLVLHSDLKIVERSHHGYDPFPDNNRILPFGSGATVFYNYIDLRFENVTDETFQFKLWLTEKCLQGELLSDKIPVHTYSVFERNHSFLRKGETFFRRNEIWRTKRLRQGGILLGEELVTTNCAKVKYIPEDQAISEM